VIEDLQKLDELEPGSDLDHRVRRRMRATMAMASQRSPAPFLPFEGAIYAVVLAAYVVYAGARAVQLFQEGRAAHVLHVAAATPSGVNASFVARSPVAVGTTDGADGVNLWHSVSGATGRNRSNFLPRGEQGSSRKSTFAWLSA